MSSNAQQLVILSKGKSDYYIFNDKNNTTVSQAIQHFQKYFFSATDYLLKESPNLEFKRLIIISSNANIINNIDKKILPSIKKPEGFCITTVGEKVVLAAKTEKGLLYAVNEFLETYLHIQYLSPNVNVIPKTSSITLPFINYAFNQKFDIRLLYYKEVKDTNYANWNKVQQFRDIPNSEWGGEWAHSFFSLVPPDKFFNTNPEYFALRNGKRVSTQLCLSNKEVSKVLLNSLKSKIKVNPMAKYWFVSQEDNAENCECPYCAATDKAEDSPAGSLIKFVNDIASFFPEKRIVTLAYSYTQKAPKKIKPAENVFIMFCTSGSYNRVKPLKDQGIGNLLQPWLKVSRNVLVWDYYINFKHFLFPLQNFKAMATDLRFYADNGVKGLFMQGNYYGGGAFDELKSYLLSKLSWNPYANIDSLVSNFCITNYGEASEYVIQSLERLDKNMQSSNKTVGLFDDPEVYFSDFLSPISLEKYSEPIEKGMLLVKNKNSLQRRLTDFVAPFDYIYLLQSIKQNQGKNNTLDERKGRLNRLTDFFKNNNASILGETFKKTEDFLKDYKNIVNKPNRLFESENLALNKPIIVKYTSSPIHAGDPALVNGVRAFLGIEQNSWVVFTQGKLDVTIDLQKVLKIQSVSGCFLKVPVVNLEFPNNFDVSYSIDNKKFFKWGRLRIVPYEKTDIAETKLYSSSDKAINCRYIRVIANCKDVLAIDEIIVK